MNEIKIHKICHIMRVIFQVLTIVVPLFVIVMWLSYPFWSVENLSGFDGMFKDMGILAAPVYKKKIAAMFHDVLPVIVTTFKCYFLAKLFTLYERMDFFASESATYIRNIGLLFIVQPIAGALNDLLVGYLLNIDNLTHHYSLTLSMGSNGFSMIITGIVIFIISWIMKLAYEMRVDQQSII